MKLGNGWLILLGIASLTLIATLLIFQPSTETADPALQAPEAQSSDEPISLATPTFPPELADLEPDEICYQTRPIAGGFIYEGIVGVPQTPNPLLADGNPVDQMISELVFEGLTRLDDRGIPQPAVAESWTISPDGLTIRFELDPTAMWHDGTQITSKDVAFTYGLLQDEAYTGADALLWQSVEITPIGETDVSFRLQEPYAPFLSVVRRGLLPAHLLEGETISTLKNHKFNRELVGNGRFRVVNDWLLFGTLRLEPVAEKFPSEPLIETVAIRFYENESARLQAYNAGEVDGLIGVSQEALAQFASLSETAGLYSSTNAAQFQLLFNLLEDERVTAESAFRQALIQSVDKSALITAALPGQAIPLESIVPRDQWGAIMPDEPLLFDTEAAQSILETAGFVKEDDAWGRIVDEKFEQVGVEAISADLSPHNKIAEAVASQWSDFGLTVSLKNLSLDEYMAALESRTFDVALVEIAPTYDPDLYDFWSQEALINGQNYAGWNSQRASEYLEAARQTYDLNERYALYRQWNDLFYDTLPAQPLVQTLTTYALRDSIQNTNIGKLATLSDRFNSLHRWTTLTEEVPIACAQMNDKR